MRPIRTRNTVLLVLVALACSACGSGDGEAGGTTPTSATTAPTGEGFEFTGYLFRVQGETQICDAILESYPPQCGGESYKVVGLDVSGVDGLQESQGVSWTDRPVTLKGVLAADGKTLAVSPNPALGGGVPPPTVEGQPGSAPG
jgi:hypothetical protein